MNRRQFLSLSTASLAAASAGAFAWSTRRVAAQGTQRRLAMPPLVDTRSTGRLDLSAQAGRTSIRGGPPAFTAGFNQGFLGPTIVMRNGLLAASVRNTLPETVTVHWHGLLVPGRHDGSPYSPIMPGANWVLDMDIAQRPTTAWYHSHAHGATARHVYSGLAGVIHHTDGRDDQRGLPTSYGVDDLTLIVQDRRFDAAGRMIYNPDSSDILNGFHGERILVNGQFDTVAAVPRGIVRLRLLNGSNARFYSFHFNDRRPLHLIATDGGFLPRPVELTYLRLAPGERAEVLVDFSEGPPPILMSARGLTIRVLEFAIAEGEVARIRRLPGELGAEAPSLPQGEIAVRRIALNMGGSSAGSLAASAAEAAHGGHGGHAGASGPAGQPQFLGAGEDGRLMGVAMNDFGINGRPFSMDRIDFEVRQGSYERWVIAGGGAGVEHPFHIHGVHFRVLSVGGAPPGPEDSGWKDTVVVAGQTEIVLRFDHHAGREAPYMCHCHILEHEDSGMMGQFTVT